MNSLVFVPYIVADDYLKNETDSAIRHEYVAGQVFAMAGAGETHNRIAGNIFFHLRAATRGTPCAVFISDMKVRIAEHDAFYYPDVLMTCDCTDTAPYFKQLPCLIAEVLSPSTETTDRREKLAAYCTLGTLRYYLLVSQQCRRIECYRLETEGRWQCQLLEQDGVLDIECGDLRMSLSVADIYEDVDFSTSIT